MGLDIASLTRVWGRTPDLVSKIFYFSFEGKKQLFPFGLRKHYIFSEPIFCVFERPQYKQKQTNKQAMNK